MSDLKKYQQKFSEARCCVLIPTYNNARSLGKVIEGVFEYTSRVIVVNDGSTDDTADILSQFEDLDLITLPSNKGKGYAIRKGFQLAREQGYKYAITLDSDGQLMPQDLPVFLEKLEKAPGSIIVGARRMDEATVPGGSIFGRKFSNFWFWVETGLRMPDTQSGYRLYPLDRLEKIKFFTNRFEFEVEVLVRAAWKEVPVTSVVVSVHYPPKEQRVTHFRPFTDFARISLLNTLLVLAGLFYYRPYLMIRNFTWKNFKTFFRQELLNPAETNFIKAASVGLGVFMGIAPVWGWQMIIAVFLAFVFRLNKIITLAASNISIPPMIPLILYLSYVTGGIVIGNHAKVDYGGITFEFVRDNFLQYITGALVFGLIAGILAGVVTYGVLVVFRKREK